MSGAEKEPGEIDAGPVPKEPVATEPVAKEPVPMKVQEAAALSETESETEVDDEATEWWDFISFSKKSGK